MQTYYFHLRDGVDVLLDADGIMLREEQIAPQALAEARSIMSHDARAGRIDLNHRIDVADGEGQIVHSLEFADAIQIVPMKAV